MTVEKALEEKVTSGKELSADEQQTILQDQEAVEGFKPAIIESEETTVGVDEVPEDETEAGQAAKKQKEEAAVEAAKVKQAEEDAAAGKTNANVDMTKLEEDLAKPEDKVDLKNYSPIEVAYYKRMRMDRKVRQVVEGERDAAKLEVIKLKKELEALKGGKPAAAATAEGEETPLDKLKKKDPTDFLTVADVIEIIEKQNKATAAAPAKATDNEEPNPVVISYVKMCDSQARAAHPHDYDAVQELSPEILDNNPEYLKQVSEAIQRGENPAEKAYELIKADPAFAELFPAAQVKAKAKQKLNQKPEEKPVEKSPEEKKKEADALAAQKLLDENKNKPKTTGSVSAGDGKTEDTGNYTLDQVNAMSNLQFAKLPKKVRNYWLEKMREE